MTDKGIVLVEVEGHVVSTHDAGLEQVFDINQSISSQSTSAVNTKAINVAKKVNTDTRLNPSSNTKADSHTWMNPSSIQSDTYSQSSTLNIQYNDSTKILVNLCFAEIVHVLTSGQKTCVNKRLSILLCHIMAHGKSVVTSPIME